MTDRQRCMKCRNYIGDPRGNDRVFDDFCSHTCADVELPKERCRDHANKIKLSLGEARKAVNLLGGAYYRCPRTKEHWHRTSQANPVQSSTPSPYTPGRTPMK